MIPLPSAGDIPSLSPIVYEWNAFPETSVLYAHQDENGFYFSIRESSCCHPSRSAPALSRKERRETLEAMEQMLGKERVARILERPEVGISKSRWDNRSLLLTKAVARRLFVSLLDVRLADFPRGSLEGRQFTLEEGRNLTPFDRFDEAFMGKPPKISEYDRSLLNPRSFRGMCERVWVIQHSLEKFRRQDLDEEELALFQAEFLASRLADREPAEGILVPSTNGWRSVDRVFATGGAYIFATRSLDPSDNHVHFVCRGTAFRPHATGNVLSGINDFLPEIGSYGIQQAWKEIASYISENAITSAEVYGKSLGGAHARYLALLLAGKSSVTVTRLTTVCPVYISSKVREIYSSLPKDRQFYTHEIQNGGRNPDHIPHIGELSWANKMTYLGGANREKSSFTKLSLVQKIYSICDSLVGPHSQQHTMGKILKDEITSPEELQKHLQGDKELERFRQTCAKILHWVTFGAFSQKTFSEFYHSMEPIESKSVSLN